MKLVQLLAWLGDFLVDAIILLGWVLATPFLVLCWCFYHPIEAKGYFVEAIPLLMSNWATRCCLGVMVLIALSAFPSLRPVTLRILTTLIFIGLFFYIRAIF